MTRWRVEDPNRGSWPPSVTVVRDTGMNVPRRRFVDAREASSLVDEMLSLLAAASAEGLVPASDVAEMEGRALELGLRAADWRDAL